MRPISLTINDKSVSATVEPRTHLADFLRESRNLTGTHLGCEHGICGACTVLIDGSPARSCITYAVACDGANITSIEGLEDDDVASALREAFSREHALQCGYCTPGMLISARDVVLRLGDASERDIRVAMSGNLCRCTGYVGIIKAIQSVIAMRRAEQSALPARSLGPVGSGHAATAQGAAPTRRQRRVSADADAGPRAAAVDFVPQASFAEQIILKHPREAVWSFFADTQAVAACLPGASVTSVSGDGQHVTGKMRVKIGPMAAEFHGTAEISRDPSTFSGTILGSGRDSRSNSATRGRIAYSVKQGDVRDVTIVEITVSYALTGMFAQFSRSGIVQDVAHRLTQTFARNLEARLAGGTATTEPATELNATSLLYAAVSGRIKNWFRRAFARQRQE
jgi:carbon-monoxide dehydrogenase small subunit